MSKVPATQRRLAAIATVLPPGATPEGSRGVILGEALRLFVAHGYTPELDKTADQIADTYGDFACRIVGAMN